MLELENVSRVSARETHIHPLSMRLEKGTLNVLLGPTLSGKTSLMRLMAGLDRPTAGRLLWDGADMAGVPVQRRNVAMVYQQFINYPTLTVYDNIASPLKLLGIAREEVDRRVRETAEMLKLTPMLPRRPLELSGGQQQRTALARALVKGADLVLLDEPLANLDYKLREELRAEIPRIFEASGAIFVYATTEPMEALLLGGNTAALCEGRVTQFGPTLEVYRRPRDAATARIFSDPPMNFLSVAKAGGKLLFGEGQAAPAQGRLAALADGRYIAGFRPNHLYLDRPSGAALEFNVRVAVTEITGSESFVHVDHGAAVQGEADHGGSRWVALTHGVRDPELGAIIPVYVDAAKVYVFGEDERLVAAPDYAEAA